MITAEEKNDRILGGLKKEINVLDFEYEYNSKLI